MVATKDNFESGVAVALGESQNEKDSGWPKLESTSQADFLIRKLYESVGFTLVTPLTPGDIVQREYGNKIPDPPAGPWLRFLDELIAVMRFISMGFLVQMSSDPDGAGFYYKLSARTIANLASIRALSLMGLDSNARMILRHHYETMILWSRARIDEEMRLEFSRVKTPEQSNHFWNKYISRSKSEKFIKNFLKPGESWIGLHPNISGRINEIMSISAHPSNIEMRLGLKSDFDIVTSDKIATREISEFVKFTLSTAVNLTVLPFCLPPEPFHVMNIKGGWNPPERVWINHAGTLEDHYTALQQFICGSFLFSQPFNQ